MHFAVAQLISVTFSENICVYCVEDFGMRLISRQRARMQACSALCRGRRTVRYHVNGREDVVHFPDRS